MTLTSDQLPFRCTHSQDLGDSTSHLRETAFLVLEWEVPRIQPVKTLEFSRRDQSSLGWGREAPLRTQEE